MLKYLTKIANDKDLLVLVSNIGRDKYKIVSLNGLIRFNEMILAYTNTEDIIEAIPEFQRDPNKWDLGKKRDFMKRVLRGLESSILLMTIDKSNRAYIIDGLQRTTTLTEFTRGDFELSNGLTYKTLIDENIKTSPFRVSLTIQRFKNEKEAVEFYIKLNKSTHSRSDLNKAIKYLSTLK